MYGLSLTEMSEHIAHCVFLTSFILCAMHGLHTFKAGTLEIIVNLLCVEFRSSAKFAQNPQKRDLLYFLLERRLGSLEPLSYALSCHAQNLEERERERERANYR